MATPLGHGLAGAILCIGFRRAGWETPSVAAAVVVANMPDLDFLPGMLVGWPSKYHHGASHSIGATVIAALALTLLAKVTDRNRTFHRHAIFFGACYFSHIVIDYFTVDTGLEIGIPALWPFSLDLLIASHPIFGDVKRTPFLDPSVITHDLWNLVIESAIFLPPLLALLYWSRDSRGKG